MFLRAAQKVTAEQSLRQRRTKVFYRLALAGLTVIVLCLLPMLLHFGQQASMLAQAEAEPFAGLQGLVVSSLDLKPIAGVQVRRLAVDANGKQGSHTAASQLVAQTNSQGWFEIPPDPNAVSDAYELCVEGQRPHKFIYGSAERALRGYQKFFLDVAQRQRERRTRFSLSAGGSAKISSTFAVVASSTFDKKWRGTLLDDKRWPSNFMFGQVAAGVYTLQGEAVSGLRLRVFINQEVLDLYHAKSGDLRLIAYDQRYLQAEHDAAQQLEAAHPGLRPSPLDLMASRASVHKGWYIATAQHYPLLPQLALQLEPASAEDAQPGIWASWDASVGTPYALLVRPNIGGEAVVCWRDVINEEGSRVLQPAVRLLGRSSPQPFVYDVIYSDPATGRDYVMQYYPYRPQRECWFSTGEEPRGYYRTNITLDLPGLFFARKVPGHFNLRLMDFTCDDAEEFGPLEYKGTAAPGKYDIDFSMAPLGEESTLRVTGDLARLSAPPQWDFYSDNTTEAYGEQAQISVQRYASYKITAILHERSGNVILVQRDLLMPPPGTLGYEYYDYGSQLVVEGLEQPCAKLTALRVFTPCAVASPAAFGYMANLRAGPTMCVTVPPEFCNVELKDYRIYLYARAVGGATDSTTSMMYEADSQRMYLEPACDVGVLQRGKFVSLAPYDDIPPKLGEYRLPFGGDNGHSWYIFEALQDSRPLEYMRMQFDNPQRRELLRRICGIDLNLPLAEDELIAGLRAYRDSPYYSVRFASSQCQELEWHSKCWKMKLPEGASLFVRVHLNDYNTLNAGQWEVYSGGECPSRMELEAMDGQILTRYFDFSPVSAD